MKRFNIFKKMKIQKKYDLILPLGENCSCAEILKKAELRKFSLPFDWSGLEYGNKDSSGGLCTKCELIFNDCSNLFNLEDLEILKDRDDGKHLFVVNKKTGLRYMHDFDREIPLETQYNNVFFKYKRRIERLYEKLNKSKSILIVYNRVVTKKYYRTKDFFNPYFLYGILYRFKQRWKYKNFNFLCFLHDENIPVTEYREEIINNKITYVYLNNMCQTKDVYAENEWLGNQNIVLKYLKKHISIK